jgi:hypothetical protein
VSVVTIKNGQPSGLLVANVTVGGGDFLVSISHTENTLIVCPFGGMSTYSDEASVVVRRIENGEYVVEDFANAVGEYTPPTQPGATSVVVDVEPEWTVRDGTAVTVGEDIFVTLDIDVTQGSCTVIGESGSVPWPGSELQTQLIFTIEAASFGPDGTAQVTDLTGQNTIVAERI